jgi:hypothetical protein
MCLKVCCELAPLYNNYISVSYYEHLVTADLQ